MQRHMGNPAVSIGAAGVVALEASLGKESFRKNRQFPKLSSETGEVITQRRRAPGLALTRTQFL
jgi:hypothetical protein